MANRGNNTFLRTSIFYGIFACILIWFIYFNEFTLGILGNFLPMPDRMASMSLDTILVPILISGTIFYIANLLGSAFEGVLTDTLVGTLYAAGFAMFFAVFLILNPNVKVKAAGYLLSAAFAVVLTYNMVTTVSRLRKTPQIRAIAVSATIYLEGQIGLRMVSLLIESSGTTMPPELASAVGNFINLGVSTAAIFTLFAVFKTSKNSYLSALGSISSNYLFSISLSLIGALYYGFFIGGMRSFAPSIVNLSPFIEWTGICVFAALIFTIMRRGMQGSIIVEDKLGQWKKHLQQVTTYKGDRFVGFTEIIDDFLERGNRELLLVNLAIFLHENNIADNEISNLLSELISYEDKKKPAISKTGRAVKIDNENMEERLGVLQRTINRIVPNGVEGITVPPGVNGGTNRERMAPK